MGPFDAARQHCASSPARWRSVPLQEDSARSRRWALEIARQMKRLGVHVSFSPDVDVNNNPG
jgi:beta-glucosidase-like glycosyl hydrolase